MKQIAQPTIDKPQKAPVMQTLNIRRYLPQIREAMIKSRLFSAVNKTASTQSTEDSAVNGPVPHKLSDTADGHFSARLSELPEHCGCVVNACRRVQVLCPQHNLGTYI